MPQIFRQQVFKHLAQHFRVNGDFSFQRFSFIDGEIVTVENIQDARAGIAVFGDFTVGKQFVGQQQIGMNPVVIAHRFKQTAIQERNLAAKMRGVIAFAFSGECVVKQRFEYVVEIVFLRLFQAEQMAQIIFLSSSPGSVTRNSEPAFLLQEVEKDDLTEQLFGKIVGFDSFHFEIIARFGVTFQADFQRGFGLIKQQFVLLEELLSNLFDFEGFFDIGKQRIALIIFQQRQELLLRGVALFVFADQKRIAARGRQLFALLDLA